jgi:hypothetical protein
MSAVQSPDLPDPSPGLSMDGRHAVIRRHAKFTMFSSGKLLWNLKLVIKCKQIAYMPRVKFS